MLGSVHNRFSIAHRRTNAMVPDTVAHGHAPSVLRTSRARAEHASSRPVRRTLIAGAAIASAEPVPACSVSAHPFAISVVTIQLSRDNTNAVKSSFCIPRIENLICYFRFLRAQGRNRTNHTWIFRACFHVPGRFTKYQYGSARRPTLQTATAKNAVKRQMIPVR